MLESAVTHQTPPCKQQKLRKLGLPALEIDALSLYEAALQGSGPPDLHAFEYELQPGTTYKQWLFSPARQRAAFHLRKMAVVRPVKHRLYKGYHQYLTTDCPLGKRRWRSGYREGQAFANVIQDCMHCSRCAFLEYETEYVGYQEVPLAPAKVHCWGHLEQSLKPKPWQTSV